MVDLSKKMELMVVGKGEPEARMQLKASYNGTEAPSLFPDWFTVSSHVTC